MYYYIVYIYTKKRQLKGQQAMEMVMATAGIPTGLSRGVWRKQGSEQQRRE